MQRGGTQMSERELANRNGSLREMSVVGRDGKAAAAAPVGRVVDPSKIDLPAAERAAEDLLRAVGADVDAPDLVGTPRRIAASLVELLTPVEFSPTTFANEGNYDELVLVRDISFQSLCMHHLLPFIGHAHVAYLPGDRIIGLSKLARVVEMFARDLQLQERMGVQVPERLEREVDSP